MLVDVDVAAGAALAAELDPAHRFQALDVADKSSRDAVAGELSDDGGPALTCWPT